MAVLTVSVAVIKQGPHNLWFPASFPTDFAFRSQWESCKLWSRDHGTLQYCNCKLGARHPDHNHMATGMLQWTQIWGLVITTTCSAQFVQCTFKRSLNECLLKVETHVLGNYKSNVKVIYNYVILWKHSFCRYRIMETYPVCDEYTFCSHLFPEKATCLVLIMTTWSPRSPNHF